MLSLRNLRDVHILHLIERLSPSALTRCNDTVLVVSLTLLREEINFTPRWLHDLRLGLVVLRLSWLPIAQDNCGLISRHHRRVFLDLSAPCGQDSIIDRIEQGILERFICP